jgi:hypothetical protein
LGARGGCLGRRLILYRARRQDIDVTVALARGLKDRDLRLWHGVCSAAGHAVNAHVRMRDWLDRRKARRLSEVASSIAEDDPRRALRLRRKALRCLAPPRRRGGARVLDPTGADAGTLLSALERPLPSTAWRWVAGRRRQVAVAALGVGVCAAALLAAVPGLRRTVFPPNLAAGKSWRASSRLDNWTDTGIISDKPAPDLFFHTKGEDAPWIIVDLETVRRLHRVEITNRLDCCRDRAQPLEVEVSKDGSTWKRVAYRRIEFREWNPSFSPTDARFVRLRIPRPSLLHLARLAVY